MSISEWLMWIFCILGGFVLGGIMFSDIIPRLFSNKDIYMLSDDHNPGATNVFIQCGARMGSLCLLLDVLKGFLPIWYACRHLDPENWLFAAVLAAPVLGHAVAPFHHFRGGKCISTAFGEMLALWPVSHIGAALAILYILFSTAIKINPNRLRSLAAFGLFGLISAVVLIYNGRYPLAVGCMLISCTAMYKHSKRFAS